jgi:hypothetical protein
MKLSDNDIGLIRIAIIDQIKNNSVHADTYAHILSNMEFGCGLELTSCEDETQALLDEICALPGCTEMRSDGYNHCDSCLKALRANSGVKGPQ